MAIVVNSIDHDYKIIFSIGEDEVEFTFRQLDYKTKCLISGYTTKIEKGEALTDTSLAVFYNIKFGVKGVKGLTDSEGNEYVLKFENTQKTALTDKCTDELLAIPAMHNALVYTSSNMLGAGIPDEIIHPLTGRPIEGIQIVKPDREGGFKKK